MKEVKELSLTCIILSVIATIMISRWREGGVTLILLIVLTWRKYAFICHYYSVLSVIIVFVREGRERS